MSYATPADLTAAAAAYSVALPSDADGVARVLNLASRDVDRFLLGVGTFDPTTLTVAQVAALRDATCAQACFRLQQGPDLNLATDDQVAAIGPLSFTARPPARLSAEAAEIVSGVGLFRRSGCAAPSPAPVPVVIYP